MSFVYIAVVILWLDKRCAFALSINKEQQRWLFFAFTMSLFAIRYISSKASEPFVMQFSFWWMRLFLNSIEKYSFDILKFLFSIHLRPRGKNEIEAMLTHAQKHTHTHTRASVHMVCNQSICNSTNIQIEIIKMIERYSNLFWLNGNIVSSQYPT